MLVPSRASRSERVERARLRIDGVREPVVARVAQRRQGALVIAQDLPFLRANARVLDEEGREARIARVAIDSERATPRLVIELAYDEAGLGPEIGPVERGRTRRDQTIGYGERLPSRAAIARRSSAPPPPRERESTLLFRTEAPLARADDGARSTSPRMERRGSEIELAWRAFLARVESAIAHLARGIAQALAALRTDP